MGEWRERLLLKQDTPCPIALLPPGSVHFFIFFVFINNTTENKPITVYFGLDLTFLCARSVIFALYCTFDMVVRSGESSSVLSSFYRLLLQLVHNGRTVLTPSIGTVSLL